jgi:two-component system, NarL family, response regulator YdfI
MSEPVRVLVADDHLIIRQGLRLILETTDHFVLVGEAANGVEAVERAVELQPDVVLMDLRMPGMDGLSAIERLHAEQPHIAVVILTTFNEDELMMRGLRAGAKGYLLKDTDRETLFNTIRAAARGETLLKPEIIARVLAYTQAPAPAAAPAPLPGRRSEEHAPEKHPLLTDREREVLEGVARGERSKEIAARLGITERTVKAHLDSIFNKLGVDSRAAAVSVAIQKGLIHYPSAG